MLIFRTAIADRFRQQFADRLAADASGYELPSEPPPPGEAEVLRTFSTEWTGYDWTGDAYWSMSPDAWFECMRSWLDLDGRPPGGLALEAGIGIGAFADSVARRDGCEVVGIDLGYAVDAAYAHFGTNPSLHIVQASVFAPPFAPETFDLVYSFGVIHHTFSTETAFRKLAPLTKRGGRLAVWVYGPRNEQRSRGRRVLMGAERVLRPIGWRLQGRWQTAFLAPIVPLYLAYQRGRVARGGKRYAGYSWREALHAARDRFTPRFAHRHPPEELSSWFVQAGFHDVRTIDERTRSGLPLGFTANTGVEGIRGAEE